MHRKQLKPHGITELFLHESAVEATDSDVLKSAVSDIA